MAKQLEPLVILQDTREQCPWRFSRDTVVQVCTLTEGDYSMMGYSDRVRVERKSLADLVMCVGPERDRFMDCCRRLQAYEFRAVVVEAAVDDVLAHVYRSATAPQSVIGTCVAIWVDYLCPVVWAGDASNAAAMVEKFFRRIAAKAVERAA